MGDLLGGLSAPLQNGLQEPASCSELTPIFFASVAPSSLDMTVSVTGPGQMAFTRTPLAPPPPRSLASDPASRPLRRRRQSPTKSRFGRQAGNVENDSMLMFIHFGQYQLRQQKSGAQMNRDNSVKSASGYSSTGKPARNGQRYHQNCYRPEFFTRRLNNGAAIPFAG